MLVTLVMTVIATDRPGLVQNVAAAVADHGGNWLESRMCRLGGQFAGILRVEVQSSREAELHEALRGLEGSGVQIIIHPEGASSNEPRRGSLARVEIVGHDRPGILRSISGVFAARGVNVEELESERVSAPMGGGTLFQARASVLLPEAVTIADLRLELEKIAADLMVDVRLEPAVVA